MVARNKCRDEMKRNEPKGFRSQTPRHYGRILTKSIATEDPPPLLEHDGSTVRRMSLLISCFPVVVSDERRYRERPLR